ncbi:multivesicular body subunit 12B isoform X4 [Mesocricetus auratus]|nr:multivesicular body subunit 12B isoform X4 [Mesocricetus auratus]XP_040591639.1 multivesicular body subunit 12B isoform X4 [Mesocricetus auratus]
MPEVKELSEALPETPMDPITGVGVVASRNRAPTGYDVVAQTADGVDADLWKDGLFKSKVTRYLCFTRSFSKENSHLGNVLVDMKLIDVKDTLPVGFIPIQETVDTQEVAFRKKRLCIKFIPRDSTEAAVCDIRIMGRAKQAPPQYTLIGELNSMGIWYRMGRVPRNHDSSQPTTPSQSSAAATPAPNLPRVPTVPKEARRVPILSWPVTGEPGCPPTAGSPPYPRSLWELVGLEGGIIQPSTCKACVFYDLGAQFMVYNGCKEIGSVLFYLPNKTNVKIVNIKCILIWLS